jgi:hypothetical protein
MKEKNVLPYDGDAALIRDISADLDWAAVTRTLIEDIPWRVETARLFGREMVVPRMTAWFGDAAYRYSLVAQRGHAAEDCLKRGDHATPTKGQVWLSAHPRDRLRG